MFFMKDSFCALDDIPISEWLVSDSVISNNTSKISAETASKKKAKKEDN